MTTQGRPLSDNFLPLSAQQGGSSGPSSGSKYRLSADMSTLNLQPPLSPVATHHHRGPRPTSEILAPANYSSPEADAIDKWVEDLQHYERTLEEMATASLDQNFKEELSHVDQWFRFLSEAERTAALYSLLQHSTQVQIRFFINTLQQMARRDPMGALLSPANPEKDSMPSQLAGAMAMAELEASQKLFSVLGQPAAAVRSNTARRLYDRHSVTLGDAEEYGRILGGGSSRMPNEFLSPRSATFAPSTSIFDDVAAQTRLKTTNGRTSAHGLYSASRPKSAIEGDGSSIFGGDWSSFGTTRNGGVIGDRTSIGSSVGNRTIPSRPKSADVSSWSLGGMPSVLDQRERGGSTTPWGLSPTVSNLNERGPIERPKSATQADLENALANFTLGNSGQRIVLDDAKNFRRPRLTPGSKMSNVPLTVPESDEKNGANIVLSMYDDRGARSSDHLTLNGRGTSMRSPAPSPRTPSFPPPTTPRSPSRPGSRSTSPAPPTPTSGLFPGHPSWEQRKPQHFGQYLDPYTTAEGDVEYLSDHSDASNLSGASSRRPSSARAVKDKKAAESVDLELLTDIPGWLRSLRLHKYNSVFESMRWQDIVKMTDEDLQAKGVAALGARRKFLKVFENVRGHCDDNNIPY